MNGWMEKRKGILIMDGLTNRLRKGWTDALRREGWVGWIVSLIPLLYLSQRNPVAIATHALMVGRARSLVTGCGTASVPRHTREYNVNNVSNNNIAWCSHA